MQDIVNELNKEVCPVHLKHAKFRITPEGIDFDACCAAFRKQLTGRLMDLITLKKPPAQNE